MSTSEPTCVDWPAFARYVIAMHISGGDPNRVEPPPHEPHPHGGAFVTLRKFGKLRGCVGTLDGSEPLAEAIRYAALAASGRDSRFAPVAIGELPDIRIEVSVLTRPELMGSIDNLQIGEHGVIVERGLNRGLFLPKVATEFGFDAKTFLARCCTEKAGLRADAWKQPDTRVLLFRAEVFTED